MRVASLVSWRDAKHHFIEEPGSGNSWLFDSQIDPLERDDLSPSRPSEVTRLRASIRAATEGRVRSDASTRVQSPEELEQTGIGEGLVRISVGIEDWHDLARDFQDALDGL